MSGFACRKISVILSIMLGFAGLTTPKAFAGKIDVGDEIKGMDAATRAAYASGVVNGIASARYNRDNENVQGDDRNLKGMACIYAWYQRSETPDLIYAAFDRYPSYPAGVIIELMVRKECGGY